MLNQSPEATLYNHKLYVLVFYYLFFIKFLSYYVIIYLTFCSDTFDENTPPVDSPEYISSLGAAIYSGMQSGDSDAVWLMQVKK